MKDGGVAESGSHNELMKLEGLYYELATTQVRRFRTHTAIECVFHTRIVLFNDVLTVTCAVVPPGSWETAADVGDNFLPSLTVLARPLTSAEIQAEPLFYLSPFSRLIQCLARSFRKCHFILLHDHAIVTSLP